METKRSLRLPCRTFGFRSKVRPSNGSGGRLVRRADLRYRFDNYDLDADRRELTRDKEAVAIGPQVFDLLLYLVANRDRVVSKDDLLDTVWGGRIVSESTLASHISAVRSAIGDSGEEQQLLRTVA